MESFSRREEVEEEPTPGPSLWEGDGSSFGRSLAQVADDRAGGADGGVGVGEAKARECCDAEVREERFAGFLVAELPGGARGS